MGRQRLGPGEGLLGQGWGQGLRVSHGGLRCPWAAGLGGQQVGADLTWAGEAVGEGREDTGSGFPALYPRP